MKPKKQLKNNNKKTPQEIVSDYDNNCMKSEKFHTQKNNYV